MESSLFRDRPARKTRMTMMVAGAVLVHAGIVEVAAMWQQPITERRDDSTVVEVIDRGQTASDDDVQYVTVDNRAPAPSQENSTPTPEFSLPSDPQPADVVPEMLEPSNAKPPSRPRHTANTPATASLAHKAPAAPGAPGANPGTVPGAGRAGVQGWKTPRPPYPVALRATGFQGATTVRITTDANGNVVTVEIVRSAGNPLMDRNTQGYVRDFWKGPPNSTRTTEFVYQLF